LEVQTDTDKGSGNEEKTWVSFWHKHHFKSVLPLPAGVKEPPTPMDHKPVSSLDERDGAPEVDDCDWIRQAEFSRAGMRLFMQVQPWLDTLGVQIRWQAFFRAKLHAVGANCHYLTNEALSFFFVK
jgi:hypothetical protein